MSRFMPFFVRLGVLMAAELLHGHWSGRWRFSGEPEASCAKLPKSDEPMVVGNWKGEPGPPLADQDLALGEIGGYFSHVFTHPSGYVVTVLIVCGRPGPIAVHSPEVCLGGEGFVLDGKKRQYKLDLPAPDKPVEFWVGQFYA